MKELQKLYITLNRFLVVIIALIALFVGKDILAKFGLLESDKLILSLIGKVLVSSALYTVLYYGGEWLIKNQLWKLIKGKFNFNGEWIGVTYYTSLGVPSSKVTKKDFKPFQKAHYAKIEQDCLNIEIKSSQGEEYVGFSSTSMNINEKGTLQFSYQVKYQGDLTNPSNKLKGIARGYEELEIHKSKGFFDKPILLSGKFYHCLTENKPLYSGSTIFIKKDSIGDVEKGDLPGYARDSFLELVKNYIKK